MKYYTVYKITNTINNKIYIGVHKTSNLDDGYMGSGTLIKRAQEKYGIEKFNKEILFNLESSEEMYLKEKELVTKKFIEQDNTYNIMVGGNGGFEQINTNNKQKEISIYKPGFHKELAKISKGNFQNNKELAKLANKKSNTPEARAKSLATKIKKGTSSEFRFWVTNGLQNKFILKTEEIPENWYKGKVQGYWCCSKCNKEFKKSRWNKKHFNECNGASSGI